MMQQQSGQAMDAVSAGISEMEIGAGHCAEDVKWLNLRLMRLNHHINKTSAMLAEVEGSLGLTTPPPPEHRKADIQPVNMPGYQINSDPSPGYGNVG